MSMTQTLTDILNAKRVLSPGRFDNACLVCGEPTAEVVGLIGGEWLTFHSACNVALVALTTLIDRAAPVLDDDTLDTVLTEAENDSVQGQTILCLVKAAAEAAKAAGAPVPGAEPPEGIHFVDGVYHKVQMSKHDRLYGKVADENGNFEYVGRKFFGQLSVATLVTAEQAAKFGHLYGACCFCARTLTDERSIEVGYGPVCADNKGLPWG